jgi:hypothetical protein
MYTPPLLITDHARRRYAERTHAHLMTCRAAWCSDCKKAKRLVAQSVGRREHDAEIRDRLSNASHIDDFHDLRNGQVREIVLLEDGDMRFVVEVQPWRNVLLTCMPTEFETRREVSVPELVRTLQSLGVPVGD